MGLPLAIWTTGAPVPPAEAARGPFAQMIREAIGAAWAGEYLVVDCENDPDLPLPDEVAGVVITGSPARLGERAPWMLRVEGALRGFIDTDVPVFGICFGHQLLGQALGGEVLPNPRGREIGMVRAEFVGSDELFGAPGDPRVVMTHLDSVVALPPGAELLARTELEPHAAVRFAERIWGVQFHPEMDGEILGHYVRARSEDLVREGFDVAALLAAASASPFGREILQRFARACAGSGVNHRS